MGQFTSNYEGVEGRKEDQRKQLSRGSRVTPKTDIELLLRIHNTPKGINRTIYIIQRKPERPSEDHIQNEWTIYAHSGIVISKEG